MAILKELAERKTAPYPLRVLFLSRRSFAEWEGETTILQGRFGRQEIVAQTPLSVDNGERLIEEAARRLAEQRKIPIPDLSGARTWLRAISERTESTGFPRALGLRVHPKSSFAGMMQLDRSLL